MSTIQYNAFSFPTQSMEGSLQLNPGDTLSIGYEFTMPGVHPATTVGYEQGQVSFAYTCSCGSPGGTLNVPYPSSSYSDPQNSSAWHPSGNQQEASVYQGQVAVPDLCAGAPILFKQGGTFTGGVCSNNPSSKINMRWHYSAAGSSGSWSGTKTVVPSSCQ